MSKFRPSVPAPLARSARRFAAILAIVLVGFLGGLGYGLLKPPSYTATAFVLVVGQPDAGIAAVQFAQAYTRLAPLPETLAWSSKGLPPSERERARRNLQASSSPDAPLVRLTGTADTPVRAAEYANAAADALVRYGTAHQQETGVRVALMTQAEAPIAPSAPNLTMSVAVGTATGLLLAGLVAATGLTSHIRAWREYMQAQQPTQAPKTAQVPPPASSQEDYAEAKK